MKNISDIAILFVDDEVEILSSLTRFLRREPYKKLFADTGKKALELLEDNDVALIITDMRMPEMNGMEFLYEVKRRYPDILVIILSGTLEPDQLIRTLIADGKIFRFISKPVEPEELKKIIKETIDYYGQKPRS